MKKKIPYAVLSTALCLSLVTPSFAQAPSKGIYMQGGVNKYYSLEQFVASTTKTTEMNTATLKNVKYLDASNKLANASDILWDGLTAALRDYIPGELDGTYNDGAVIVDDDGVVELTVKSAVAVNATTVLVTFSNDDAVQLPVSPALTDGLNDRTVTYNSKTYEIKDVPYHPVSGPAVDSVTFLNYRHIQVAFNTTVGLASAANPANYYFEIVDGNAGLFGYDALNSPTLQDSNQLSEIETAYPGGAAAYWDADNENIVATNVNGKTLVDIHLPEDARFTNLTDDTFADDIERTLYVNQQSSDNGPETQKAMLKETVVNVAVRNVRTSDGKLAINTVVKPIIGLDTIKPVLDDYKVVAKDICRDHKQLLGAAATGIGKELNNGNPIELVCTDFKEGRNQVGQNLVFQYSEPVFDGHDLDKSDLESYRDLALYVNGKKIASRADGNLDEFMEFNMGHSNYEDAKLVVLDAEKAVKHAYGEAFTTGKDYNIYFVGVTDLAGNIEVASEHFFKVRFLDRPVEDVKVIMPVVKDVAQVADNMFRVEFNRAGVEARLEIYNSDGEGGVLKAHVPPSVYDAKNKTYYSYVDLNAMDNELFDPILNVNVTKEGCWLAYDGQDYIDRQLKITNVVVEDGMDPVAKEDLLGDDFDKGTMRLYDDILSPAAVQPAEVAYESRGSQIVIPVKDIVPWTDNNIPYDAAAILYNYDSAAQEFTNEINGFDRDYLPIKVSYVDGNGATHEAMVTNRDLRPDSLEKGSGADDTYLNKGISGSIDFDTINNLLILNLKGYTNLVDDESKLVEGANYKVEIPKGYFTDPARDIILGDDTNFQFGGNEYDLEYVDDARIPQLASFIDGVTDQERSIYLNRWKELGYTSIEQTVNQKVANRLPDPEPVTYVPQTSKELIYFDASNNQIWVEFTCTDGSINLDTLKSKNNYILNGKSIAAWDAELGTNTQIDYVVKDGKHFATFVVPQDSIQQDGDVEFTVQGVAHPQGGTMTPVTTVIAVLDNYRPVVIDAKATGQRQIVLTFNEPLQYLVDSSPEPDQFSAANNFKVTCNGVELTVLEAVLPELLLGGHNNVPSDRELTLNLGSNIPDTGDLKVEIVKDQNGNLLLIDMSENRNPMKLATYNVAR